MKVSELMTRIVASCRMDDSLTMAAQTMWERDCGAVPVVDAESKVVAMITDRDICMAAYTQGKRLDESTVATAASRGVVVVHEDETIDHAEALMRKHQVRRLPVVTRDRRLVGMLSLNDLARHLHRWSYQSDGLSSDGIAHTLASISRSSPAGLG